MRRFRDIAVAPEAGGEPPADFHGSEREGRVEIHDGGNAAEAHDFAGLAQFHGVEAVTAAADHAVDGFQHGVRFRMAAAEGKKLHDLFVGVDFAEQVTVALLPLAQNESLCLSDDHGVTKSVLR
ncbi:hypothetical protein D3C78_1493550 [compost metagenome]